MKGFVTDLVSTIIPVYNRASMLREAVASVIAQTYRPIEIIVVDDGSTDDTVRACDELAKKSPVEIKVIHQQNTGPGLAREAGRLLARGEFIQYLDSDDLLLPGKFQAQVSGLRSDPGCGVSYGRTRYRHRDGAVEPLPWKGSGARVETMFPSFLQSRWWDTPTPLYRDEVCQKAGPWTDLRLEEDWEYDCRIAAQGIRLHYCNEFVSEVRDHDQSRLCGGPLDSVRLKERARAHSLIFSHARSAGMDESFVEMQHFARELFLLSRQCGAAGLSMESRDLFGMAKSASGEIRARGFDFRVYEFLSGLFDWRFVGKISCYADKFRT